jgi:acyl-CoA reductase-like NAD-dependent aldehyde dehydrogenase
MAAMITRPDVAPQKLLIGGQWTDASSGRAFKTINPATEEPICDVAEGTAADIDRAVQAARKAFESGPWPKMSASERGKLLWRIADLLERSVDDFAMLESMDAGKPLGEAKAVDLGECIEVLRYYAGFATKITGETLPAAGASFVYTLREPVGVIGAITPWNFPLLLSIWKIAPALAAGNTVVHKPASWTPLTALRFAKLCQEAGLPDGVLNVVTGPGSSTGQALVTHPGVDKIAFTGETSTGKSIMRSAADTLKRVSLELGGKSPNIVFADADLDAAARGAINGIFYNKGEVCCAGSRLLVEESAHDALLERIQGRLKKFTVGDPLDPKTRMGPVVSRSQLDKVQAAIEAGKKEGAKLVAGGDRPPGLSKGYYLNPTLFDGARNDMTIAREEIFGPVLVAIPFKTVEDAVSLGNDTPYGLSAAVWTKDVKKAHRAARALKAGTVWVNTYNLFDPTAPFGGYKQSGFGRELGKDALDLYTQVKTVWVDLS